MAKEPNQPMKIAVMGAGGIGGYYGGMLARAGEDVSLIARGAHLEAIRERGLTVMRDQETFTVRPSLATDDPARVGPVQLIVLATKAYDLDAAARTMRPLLGEDTVVLPLLNGVDIPERVARHVPAAQVLAGLTYAPANRPAPGVVRQPGPPQKMVFGEVDGSRSQRAQAILALLERCGIQAELTGEVNKAVWSKYMFVTSNGGVSCVTGAAMGTVLEHPETRALYEACCREVEAVARARGIKLDEDIVRISLTHAEAMPPDTQPSMLQDLKAGKPLELDVLNGTMARLGRELQVPVPVNTLIYAALKHRAEGLGEP